MTALTIPISNLWRNPHFGIIPGITSGRRRAAKSARGITTNMPAQASDGELIQQSLPQGDERAFEQLMRRHYDRVYRRLLNHCKHPEDAADLAQQLWIRVVNNLGNYRDDGKFGAFLMRATSNMLTDYWRRKGVKDQVI
ncbi:MAG TPA: sigma-70 family RNA polymerase sigma factor, partial [Gammaproteobacteria bacterium]|nr:sigma-70 family RNA polymerase sigma factor [Gammaproteobacteria bacterium]